MAMSSKGFSKSLNQLKRAGSAKARVEELFTDMIVASFAVNVSKRVFMKPRLQFTNFVAPHAQPECVQQSGKNGKVNMKARLKKRAGDMKVGPAPLGRARRQQEVAVWFNKCGL